MQIALLAFDAPQWVSVVMVTRQKQLKQFATLTPIASPVSFTSKTEAAIASSFTDTDSRVSSIVRMTLWTMRFICLIMVTVPHSILSILELCSVSKVRDVIMGFIVIQVTRFKMWRTWANKGRYYHKMNAIVFRFSLAAQAYLKITIAQGLFQYSTATSPSRKTAHLSVRRNLVKSFISDHGTPFFGRVKLSFRHRLELPFKFEMGWQGRHGFCQPAYYSTMKV